MSRGTLLLIAPYFPPRRRVGSLRPFRFAVHLARRGWEVRVVCLRTDGALTPREEGLLEGIKVLALSTGGGDSGASKKRVEAKPSDTLEADRTREKQPRLKRLVNQVGDWVDSAFPVDTWWPVLQAQSHRIRAFGEGCNIVFSTADPWSSHVVASQVAQRLGVPWVADFRDPWTLCDVRPLGRQPLAQAADRRVEAKLLGRASRIVFTAEQTSALYRQGYPEHAARIFTLQNSYDSAMLGLDGGIRFEAVRGLSPVSTRSTLDVLFFGRFRPLSPATPVIEALRRLPPQVRAQIRVLSTGPLTSEDEAQARQAGVFGCFETVPQVPYERALELLAQADLLLVSTATERDEILPAKLWDYLPAGRPILSLTRSSEVGQILDETGTGVQVTTVELAEKLAACVEAKAAQVQFPVHFAPDTAAILAHDAGGRADMLTDWLTELIG